MYFLGLKFLLCWAESNCTRMFTLFSASFGGEEGAGGIRCDHCRGFGFSIFCFVQLVTHSILLHLIIWLGGVG